MCDILQNYHQFIMSLVAYDSSADDVSDEEPSSSSKTTQLLYKNTSLLEKKNRDPVKITVPSLSDVSFHIKILYHCKFKIIL